MAEGLEQSLLDARGERALVWTRNSSLGMLMIIFCSRARSINSESNHGARVVLYTTILLLPEDTRPVLGRHIMMLTLALLQSHVGSSLRTPQLIIVNEMRLHLEALSSHILTALICTAERCSTGEGGWFY